jgi:hypothetical protein
VPTSPLNAPEVQWSFTQTGDHVRVPVFAYKTRERAPATIWGTALQLGMRAVESLRQTTSHPLISCTLVLGDTCHDLADGYRCYVGMTFRTKD